jgi:hypothetical protein
VSLTTYCCTSGNNESFMRVTIHFVDDDFKLQTMLLKCAVFSGSHTTANLSYYYRGKCDVGGFLIFEWTLPSFSC